MRRETVCSYERERESGTCAASSRLSGGVHRYMGAQERKGEGCMEGGAVCEICKLHLHSTAFLITKFKT